MQNTVTVLTKNIDELTEKNNKLEHKIEEEQNSRKKLEERLTEVLSKINVLDETISQCSSSANTPNLNIPLTPQTSQTLKQEIILTPPTFQNQTENSIPNKVEVNAVNSIIIPNNDTSNTNSPSLDRNHPNSAPSSLNNKSIPLLSNNNNNNRRRSISPCIKDTSLQSKTHSPLPIQQQPQQSIQSVQPIQLPVQPQLPLILPSPHPQIKPQLNTTTSPIDNNTSSLLSPSDTNTPINLQFNFHKVPPKHTPPVISVTKQSEDNTSNNNSQIQIDPSHLPTPMTLSTTTSSISHMKSNHKPLKAIPLDDQQQQEQQLLQQQYDYEYVEPLQFNSDITTPTIPVDNIKEWVRYYDDNAIPYYINIRSNESSWEAPQDGYMTEEQYNQYYYSNTPYEPQPSPDYNNNEIYLQQQQQQIYNNDNNNTLIHSPSSSSVSSITTVTNLSNVNNYIQQQSLLQQPNELNRVIKTNDLKSINVLLKKGINPNGRDKNGHTPLYNASFLGLIEAVDILLNCDYNINIEGRDNDGRTALHAACIGGHLNIVKLLLQNCANPNCIDKDYNTPLHFAVEGGFFKIVKELVKYNANVNSRNKRNFTPYESGLEIISNGDVTTNIINIVNYLQQLTDKDNTDGSDSEDDEEEEEGTESDIENGKNKSSSSGGGGGLKDLKESLFKIWSSS